MQSAEDEGALLAIELPSDAFAKSNKYSVEAGRSSLAGNETDVIQTSVIT